LKEDGVLAGELD
jgi:hypothetical protein